MAKNKSKSVQGDTTPTTSEFKVLETIYASPTEIFPQNDSRVRPAANQDEIDTTLAISLFKHGQEQPVNAYRDAVDGKLIPFGGHTRRRAGLKLIEGFEAVDPDTGKKATFHVPDFKLRVDVIEVKDEADAFLKGLVDNVYRSKLTPVQQALAQEKLRETYGWSDTKIASLFGYNNTNRVAQLKKLLKLESEIIDAVHEDRLALSIAADVLYDLKPEQRLTIIAQATDNDTNEIVGSKVKDIVRELEASKGSGKGKGGKADDEDEGDDEGEGNANLKRNLKHFRSFVAGLKQDEKPNENAIALFTRIEQWFDNKVGDRSLLNAVDQYVS